MDSAFNLLNRLVIIQVFVYSKICIILRLPAITVFQCFACCVLVSAVYILFSWLLLACLIYNFAFELFFISVNLIIGVFF